MPRPPSAKHAFAAPDAAALPAARRIGVLTLHRCINYGSYWQARSLVEWIRAHGDHAVVLDHHSLRVSRAEWRCAVSPLLPVRSSPYDAARYAVKGVRFAAARAGLPRSGSFPLDRPARMESFDVVVVGSDEVWNLAHPMYGACPLFFGEGVRADRLAAYAASFGSYDAARGLGSEWSDRLRRFEAISVRDENSRRILEDAMGGAVEIALDPCLQHPLPPRGRWRGPDRPFIAVYGHSFTPGFADRIRRWAASSRMPLVSVGYRNHWADDQWITASPDDFAHAMGRAAAVATNFFHGCVYALVNRKPFACEPSAYRANKIEGLLTLLGAEAHMMPHDAGRGAVDERLTSPPHPAVLQRLDALRGASERCLRRALA